MGDIFDHIQGEFHMFQWCYHSLKNGGLGGELNRMTEECFLLHTRNLYEFLYKDKKKYRADILAVSYIGSSLKADTKLSSLKDRIDVQLSHISEKRLDAANQIAFVGEYDYIYSQIFNDLQKYNTLVLSSKTGKPIHL